MNVSSESGFSDKEMAFIDLIVKAEKAMPEEFWCVAAAQELACILAKNEQVLDHDDQAMIVGAAAVLMRLGRNEFSAELQASIALGRARRR